MPNEEIPESTAASMTLTHSLGSHFIRPSRGRNLVTPSPNINLDL